jgi:hypothetical protein
MDLRDHVGKFPYGTMWRMSYNGQDIIARKDYHTWTYRGGQLLTGICIPGITLYAPSGSAQHVGALPEGSDPLAGAPDPSAAVYGADETLGINWSLVAVSGAAVLAILGAFAAALHYAGHR